MSRKRPKFSIFLIFAVIFIAVVFLFGQNYLFSDRKSQSPEFFHEISQVLIKDALINVEIVQTRAERSRGLSGRESLGSNSGMLFVFETLERHGIWMIDMNFPIDILWIGKEPEFDSKKYVVVDIKHNATPESFPEVFRPSVPANFVLEVNAGFVQENEIMIGDEVTFK